MLPKATGFWYRSMVENPMLSGSIGMEGMQEFLCAKTSILDGQGTLTISQLSGFQLSLFFLLFVCKAGKSV